jgi:hypothetical protein
VPLSKLMAGQIGGLRNWSARRHQFSRRNSSAFQSASPAAQGLTLLPAGCIPGPARAGFVVSHPASIADGLPKRATARARHSGGGSGAPCWRA